MTIKQKTRSLKAVGINIYGGGFTLGVMNHFQVLAQLEEIDLGKKTFDMNFGGVIPRPLDHKEWGTYLDQHKNVPFVYANPPCAPWSSANTHPGKTKESRFLDKRLSLTRSTYEAALAMNPQVFISESVENAYNIGKSHYEPYVDMWMKAGYSVTLFLTDAILHGAPCQRRRFHLIAHKDELMLGNCPKIDRALTVRDAIWDLRDDKTFGTIPQHEPQPMHPNIMKLLPYVPPGGVVRRVAMMAPGYPGPGVGFLVKKFHWDYPSHTMVGFGFAHPDGKRMITFREAMRMCTYPDHFLAHAAVEVVDVVLPVVGDFLAGVAKRTIKTARARKPQFEIIDWRPQGRAFHHGKLRQEPLKYEVPKGIKFDPLINRTGAFYE